MNLLIVAPEKLAKIEELNAVGDPLRQLLPAALPDGRPALNADLLEDSGPGQTWETYGEILRGLPRETVEV